MLIRELFSSNVTRDIPAVVYFHEQTAEKLQAEVSEYIITGGHAEQAAVGPEGIHEQLVRLLGGISSEFAKPGGPELPAAWISGFYGSGKSSFAKLVGLALDGAVLADGTSLEAALLARDDSPRRQVLVNAWRSLRQRIDPMAVVFDIGGVARDNEHIHAAALRQIQVRLGYSKHDAVAENELKLQRDNEWPHFEQAARRVLGKEWRLAKDEEQAADHFSHVLHVMNPERYRDPTSWIDSRARVRTDAGKSVGEVVEAISAMLTLKAKGKALFIVVDEVSQYVDNDEGRMLKLQSFVSELGQRLKGAAWLLATGQRKLEDQGDQSNLGKLKDRFPSALRVHLSTTNIRDVVHKRLLRKTSAGAELLRALFQKHHSDLKLYGYSCATLTEDDFVEVYPMLPGHVDLLLKVTSNLARATPGAGDTQAIRGLLQLLGLLFREQQLADRAVGDLVTLDAIFDVLRPAFNADVEAALTRTFSNPEVQADAMAQRAAKVVALLELGCDDTAVTADLVAACLYARLGAGNCVVTCAQALENLHRLNLVSYSEKSGFKLQTSAGQEWEAEREDQAVTSGAISEIVQSTLKSLISSVQDRPKHRGRSFPWTLWFSDGHQIQDLKLIEARDEASVALDFRYLQNGREAATWVQKSAQEALQNRVIWVVGDGAFESTARDLFRSRKLLEKYRPRFASLPRAKQQLVLEEERRLNSLELTAQAAMAFAFQQGALYFRGQQLRPMDMGAAFTAALVATADRLLPDLYPHANDWIVVTEAEILQLFEPELLSLSTKFLSGALGIVSLDDHKYVPKCTGEHPKRIAAVIQKSCGLSGQSLLATLMAPPFGYSADLVRVCCAGLLRAKLLRVQTEVGDEATSYRDAGVRDVFTKDRAFKKAKFLPPTEELIGPRDRIAIGKFFEQFWDAKLDRDDEVLADAAFKYFPVLREQLREFELQFGELPGRPPLPEELSRLALALADCCRYRKVSTIVVELKRHLDVMRQGVAQLRILQTELGRGVVSAVREAASIHEFQLAQLREPLLDLEGGLVGLDVQLAADAAAIAEQLGSATPWRGIQTIDEALSRVCERYVEARRNLVRSQTDQAETIQSRIRALPGFEALSAEQAHRVQRPVLDVQVSTSPTAVSPTLQVLHQTFRSRIDFAEALARDRLDEERRATAGPVVKVGTNFLGREVQTREQLQALLGELEAQIGPLLDQGDRVRIV